jgi:hypothetical protein
MSCDVMIKDNELSICSHIVYILVAMYAVLDDKQFPAHHVTVNDKTVIIAV